MKRILHVFSAVWLTIVGSVCLASDEREDAALLDGLRDRRLFDLGGIYCERELGSADLTQRRQASLTIEWMRTLTAQAFHAPADRRADYFRAAQQLAIDFASDNSAHPRKVLVDVQYGLVDLAHATLLRQELEAGLGTSRRRDEALALIRQAINRFDEVDEFLETEIPQRYRTEPGPDDLNADQLLALRNRVKYQKAQAIQCRAQLYGPTDRLNRIDALAQVVGEYEQLVATVPQENRLWWEATVERVHCMRLLGQPTQALMVLNQLPAPTPDKVLEARIVAERILAELAQDKPSDALKRALNWSNSGNVASAEIEFAALKCMVRLSEDPRESKDRQDQWQKQAVAQTERIEAAFGPYWGRRSSRLLVASASEGSGTANYDVLMRVGDEAVRKNELEEATAAYEQAAEVASKNQQLLGWFEAGRKAGLVKQQLEDHGGAAEWLRDVSTGAPKIEQAPQTHLQAAWNLSRLAPTDAAQLALYAEVLEENISTWPESAAADQARLWLGRLLEYQQDYRTAFNVLLDCNVDSELLPPAMVQAMRCAELLCQQARSTGNDTGGMATALADRFEQMLPEDEEAEWTGANALAAIGAARISLLYGTSSEVKATELLERLNQHTEAPLENNWRQEADGLLVIAIARQPDRRGELPQLLERVSASSPERLLTIAAALEQLVQTATGSSRESLARAALPIVQQIKSTSVALSPPQIQQVERMSARLMAAAGNLEQAIEAFRELIRENPRDGVLIEELARLLTDLNDADQLDDALALWRQLARGSPPQSDRWYRAKYHVALVLTRQGQTEEANRLLRFLKETPPGWDQSSLKDSFEQLLRNTNR